MPRTSKASGASAEYMTNGVAITPAIPSSGENLKVIYDGLLAKNGATDILAHVGYSENWNNVYDYRMTRTGTGFETSITVSSSDTLNICFKDCANNWDNNSGKNYTFDII